MISMNKALILGRVGSDPVSRATKGDGKIIILSIATNQKYKDKEGNYIEKTEWHEVMIAKPAVVSLIENRLKKGDEVYIEGSLCKSKWMDESGKEKSSSQIHVKDPEHVFKFEQQKSVVKNLESNSEEKTSAPRAIKKKARA